jgi:hypothetical protein
MVQKNDQKISKSYPKVEHYFEKVAPRIIIITMIDGFPNLAVIKISLVNFSKMSKFHPIWSHWQSGSAHWFPGTPPPRAIDLPPPP